jgi:hypothetical protein
MGGSTRIRLHPRPAATDATTSLPNSTLEAAHRPFALAGGLMGVFRPVVQPFVLAVFRPGQDLLASWRVAGQPVGHDDLWILRH